MDDKTKKKELEKRKRKSYEDGFRAKCAEHGIDPKDLLEGLWSGKCSDETVKAAATAVKEAGWLGDWGKNMYQGTIGNLGRLAYNAGEATGINRVGRWAGGDTWQAAQSGVGSGGYKGMHNPFNVEGNVGPDPGNTYQGPNVRSIKQWNAMDPNMQNAALRSGSANLTQIQRMQDQAYQDKLKAQNASGGQDFSWI